MGLDKEGSKGGGYVGGFFHLFDWKAKSRKKLFSSKSEVPEHYKQGKKSDDNLPTTRVYLMDEDERGMWLSGRGNADYSCSSSVTDEEGCGSRGPNVVARLMGLDSMPATYSSEPYSTPFFDAQSLQDADCRRRRKIEYSQNYHQMLCSEDLFRNFAEPNPQRIVNRPFEKFQTETLPPKSAKTIPITQHKLLSPIKCPGFVPSMNAAHIMEAAARIIESVPPATDVKSQMSRMQKAPVVKPSPVPFRVRDMKEKVEAAQKTASRLNETSRRQADSDSSKSNRQSISLAIQAKVNVQKREGLILTPGERSQSMAKLHEQNENMPSQQPSRTQPRLEKNMHKKSSSHNAASGALRQNNQKQNCQVDKEKSSSKPNTSRKVLPRPPSKTKTGSRKSEALENDMENFQSNPKNLPRKKRLIGGSLQSQKNKFTSDDSSSDKNKNPVQKNFCLVEDSRKKATDVVSFTFTSPIARSITGSEPDNLKLPSPGHNVLGSDALSKLLEQKLRELSYEVGSSSSCSASATLDSFSSSASVFQDSGLTPGVITSKTRLNAKREHTVLDDSLGYEDSMTVSSSNPDPLRKLKHELQGLYFMEVEPTTDAKQLLDSWHPSPISVLDPSFVTESYFSSDSMDCDSSGGDKQSISQAADIMGRSPLSISRPVEADTELSDSASSISISGNVTLTNSTKWEAEYVNEILSNVEFMFEDVSLGRAESIIHQDLSEQLESRRRVTGTENDDSRLTRKALFDCITECTELRFRRFVGGGFRAWELGLATVRRKEKLAEDMYREISGLRGFADSLVDDLVDRDMSTKHGKWLDFEPEVFELGVEIEGSILDSLIDGVISGILRL